MKKRMIALAVTAAMFGAGSAFAAAPATEISVNGFADVLWLISQDNEAGGVTTSSLDEGQFSVNQTEVNFDTANLFIALGTSGASDYTFGQAFFKYQIADGWDMKGGKFDSNLTADAGNAPDMQFTMNSLLFQGLQFVGGNKLTGLGVMGAVGPATITVAYANDTSITSGEGKNSVALLVNAMPMDSLDLEFGMLTQEDDPATTIGGAVGNLMDINGTYKIQGFTVGLDYMTGSDGDTGEFDNGFSLWGGYDFGNGFNVKARLENVGYVDGNDDAEATELYASYALTDNLAVALDLYNVDNVNGVTDVNMDATTVEFVATF